MKKVAILLLSLSMLSAFATSEIKVSSKLKNELSKENTKVVDLFKSQFEYTLNLDWKNAKCLAQETNTPVGLAGTCLVSGFAQEENATVTIAVSKTNHYSGSGETEGELSVKLISYEL